MAKVNLDAMIIRQDFVAERGSTLTNRFKQITINNLRFGDVFLSTIRKPDFQRETRDWDTKQICNFLNSIINRHFIPAIILWQNLSALTFVVDGAHRISALMAWVNDDYGDGAISSAFYGGQISDEQKKIAKKTREETNKTIGSYASYIDSLSSPDKYTNDMQEKARSLSSFSFEIQWIDGDVSVAEKSFFNINQKAVPINSIEIELLENRTMPRCIATRAITYSGAGYKYWKNFLVDKQSIIEKLSKDINELLFLPPYRTPLQTLDVSVAGKNQNNIAFHFELVNYISNKNESADTSGDQTIKILKSLKTILAVLNSKEDGSLGLHPIIYFYSKQGNFKPAMFYAVFLFVKDLYEKKKLKEFTSVRKFFEHIVYKHDYVFDQINRDLRSSKKSARVVADLYYEIMNMIIKNKTLEIEQIEKVFLDLIKTKFPKLKTESNDDEEVFSKSSNLKAARFIVDSVENINACGICGGALHTNSISLDHLTRVREGGQNTVDNSQLAHPFCNTGYKN